MGRIEWPIPGYNRKEVLWNLDLVRFIYGKAE